MRAWWLATRGGEEGLQAAGAGREEGMAEGSEEAPGEEQSFGWVGRRGGRWPAWLVPGALSVSAAFLPHPPPPAFADAPSLCRVRLLPSVPCGSEALLAAARGTQPFTQDGLYLLHKQVT